MCLRRMKRIKDLLLPRMFTKYIFFEVKETILKILKISFIESTDVTVITDLNG